MRSIAAVPVLIALLGANLPGTGTTSSDALEVIFFDVGQGDCALVISPAPDQKVIVIDGGFKSTARASIGPYLEARGIDTIDLMILTHPDMDHVSGLRALIDDFTVLEIWDPGFDFSQATGSKNPSGTYSNFRTLAQNEAGDRYYRPFDEQFVTNPADDVDDDAERHVILGRPEEFGTIEIIPLHSNSFLDGPTRGYQINNSSIVVKIEFGSNSILFTGDANGRSRGIDENAVETSAHFTEAALLEIEANNDGILESTVLKVPHHGSLTSSSQQFIDEVRPQWAIISSGVTSHNLPRPGTLTRYGGGKANIIRTDVLDESDRKGDDHIVLIMGRDAGHLIWQQMDTSTLLERVE